MSKRVLSSKAEKPEHKNLEHKKLEKNKVEHKEGAQKLEHKK